MGESGRPRSVNTPGAIFALDLIDREDHSERAGVSLEQSMRVNIGPARAAAALSSLGIETLLLIPLSSLLALLMARVDDTITPKNTAATKR